MCTSYSSTCPEWPSPVRSECGPSWQVAARYRDINTTKTVDGTLRKWPAKPGGRSPKGPAVAGATVRSSNLWILLTVEEGSKFSICVITK